MKIEENDPRRTRRARRKKIPFNLSSSCSSCPAWIILFLFVIGGCGVKAASDPRRLADRLTFSDDFQTDSGQWITELENGGSVKADHSYLDINVPAGATVWFKPLLTGPVMISYKAIAVSNGGVNDRVSDLNCFWMARDSRNIDDLFAIHRSGKFADYNQLLTYYVGVGGNGNTTTRFRRYIGSTTTRPLRPQNDLRDPGDLLVAINSRQFRSSPPITRLSFIATAGGYLRWMMIIRTDRVGSVSVRRRAIFGLRIFGFASYQTGKIGGLFPF